MSSSTSSPSATSGTHTYDEDSEHGSSPAPKRARHSNQSKQKRKPMNLAGIIHVPMDIFAEITSYLDPLDILSLARTTKHFRTLLMQRSAKHIWSAAERNIPGLPPCPEHLDEPEYAALVFGKWCSECGTTVSRRVDAVLCVKLCNHCRERMIVGNGSIPIGPFTLTTTYSLAIKSPARYNTSYALIGCVDEVVTMLMFHASNGDSIEYKLWEQNRKATLERERAFANALDPFLDSVDERRDDEVEALKAKRFTDIKARLMQLGWEEIDCHVTHYPLLRDWQKLVAQPKPLTDRIWDNIFPKLVPILTTNRNERLARERKQRRRDRVARIRSLLVEFEDSTRRFVELKTVTMPGPSVTAVLPFPGQKAALKLSVVRSILRQDVSGDRAAELFDERRAELERDVDIWRHRLEEELGRMMDKAGGTGIEVLLNIAKRHWDFTEWDYSSTIFTEQSTQYLNGVSSQKVLRADSVFQLGGPTKSFKTCCFYPDVVHALQARLNSSQPQSPFDDTDESDSDEGYGVDGYRKSLNLSGVSGFGEGKRAAKRLLRCLGRPHAAYLEMKAIGERFACQRCWVQKPMGWAEIVEHYANSHPGHNTTKCWFAHRGTRFNNEHETPEDKAADEVADKKESRVNRRRFLIEETEAQSDTMPVVQSGSPMPESSSARPLVKILSFEEAEEALAAASVPRPVRCRICESVAENNDDHVGGPMPRPEGSREVIIQHLVDVHELPEEKWEIVLKVD